MNAAEKLIAEGKMAAAQRERFLSNVHVVLGLAYGVGWNEEPVLKAVRSAARRVAPRAPKYGDDESVDIAPVLRMLSGASQGGRFVAANLAVEDFQDRGSYVAALRRDAAFKLALVTACRSQELIFARDEQRVEVDCQFVTLYRRVRVLTGASLAGAFEERPAEDEMMRLFSQGGNRVFSFKDCARLSLRFRNTKCERLSSWIDVERLRARVLADRRVPHRSSAALVLRLCPIRAIEAYVGASRDARASLGENERDALFISEKAQVRPARAGADIGAAQRPRSSGKVFFPVGHDVIAKDLKEVLADGDMPKPGGRVAGPHYLRGLCASLLADFGLPRSLVLRRMRDTEAVFQKNYYRRSTTQVLQRMAAAKARLKSNEEWTASEIPFV